MEEESKKAKVAASNLIIPEAKPADSVSAPASDAAAPDTADETPAEKDCDDNPSDEF